jgi:hypothetical protein
MVLGPLKLVARSWSKTSTVNQTSCDGCFRKDGRSVYYDYERTSTPAGLSPNGNSFQMALLEPNRVSTVFSYQQNMVDCINLGHHFPKGNCRHFDPGDWLKYDPLLPRHSRSRPGILDCLLVQSSQQHGCLFGKITLILALSGI